MKTSPIVFHSLAELELDEVFLPVHNPHTAVHLHLQEGVKTPTVEDSRTGTSRVLHTTDTLDHLSDIAGPEPPPARGVGEELGLGLFRHPGGQVVTVS